MAWLANLDIILEYLGITERDNHEWMSEVISTYSGDYNSVLLVAFKINDAVAFDGFLYGGTGLWSGQNRYKMLIAALELDKIHIARSIIEHGCKGLQTTELLIKNNSVRLLMDKIIGLGFIKLHRYKNRVLFNLVDAQSSIYNFAQDLTDVWELAVDTPKFESLSFMSEDFVDCCWRSQEG